MDEEQEQEARRRELAAEGMEVLARLVEQGEESQEWQEEAKRLVEEWKRLEESQG